MHCRANVNLANFDGNSALHVAAFRGSTELVQLLLDRRADVDAPDHLTGKTALVKASYVGHSAAAMLLIEASADVNAKDNQGYTALAFACSFNHDHLQQVNLNPLRLAHCATPLSM